MAGLRLYLQDEDTNWEDGHVPGQGNDSTLGAERRHRAEWRVRGW